MKFTVSDSEAKRIIDYPQVGLYVLMWNGNRKDLGGEWVLISAEN